jgi:hypothetical protein
MLEDIRQDYERRLYLSGMSRKATILHILFKAFQDSGFRWCFSVGLGVGVVSEI